MKVLEDYKKPKEVILYCDGFMKSKKEKIGGAIIRFMIDGKLLPKFKSYFHDIDNESLKNYIMYEIPQTNIVSEFYAIILALYNAEKYLDHIEDCKVFIHSDSEVVVDMLRGYNGCSAKHLIPLYKLSMRLYKRNEERLFAQWVTRKKIVEVLGI